MESSGSNSKGKKRQDNQDNSVTSKMEVESSRGLKRKASNMDLDDDSDTEQQYRTEPKNQSRSKKPMTQYEVICIRAQFI